MNHTTTDIPGLTAQTKSLATRRINPALTWAIIGSILLALQAYIMITWATSANFVPTNPGDDPISKGSLYFFRAYEIICVLSVFLMLWYLVIKPWKREGRPTIDGMLVISWILLMYQDPFLNYTSTQYYLNSHLINFGSWTMGSTPGWMSPNGNLLPSPIANIGAYGWFGFLPAIAACAAMRKYKTRFPKASVLELILIAFVFMCFFDLIGETLMIRAGLFAYPGHIEGFTLWSGTLHQFPLNEMVFMAAVMTATASLRYFVNDRGETLVERGLQKLNVSSTKQNLLRFLAVYGWVHLTMLLMYNVPQQWFASHIDEVPQGFPSYLENNMCVMGPEKTLCPGPGVDIPRTNNI